MPRHHRRTVLRSGGALALAALAGCNGDIPFGPNESADVFLNNNTDEERTVTVTVDEADDGERLVDETVTVAAGGTATLTNVVNGEAVVVTVAVADGPEGSDEWTDTGGENALSVSIEADAIGFTVAAGE